MKLLVFDTIFPKGHKALNNRLLSFIQSCASVTIVNKNDYINEKDLTTTTKTVTPKLFEVEGKKLIETQINLLRNFLSVLKTIKIKSFDKIIFFTFDTLNFVLEYPFLSGKPTYLVHHRNTTELQNKWKRRIFKIYCNKVHHIVFAQFIADYLIATIGVNPELVHVLPHPILISPSASKKNIHESEKKVFIAIAYSNDEELIDRILSHEQNTHLLSRNNIKLVIRSKGKTSKGESIEIINGHLSETEYAKIYHNATGVILPYPQWYRSRYSGAVMDAIIHYKPVIGSDIPIFREFEKEYPSFCSHFSSVENLFDRMINTELPKGEFAETEYKNFLEKHSDRLICNTFRQIVMH